MSPGDKIKDAWERYTKTSDYLGCANEMRNKGMVQPYIDNILQRAFHFAWWNCYNAHNISGMRLQEERVGLERVRTREKELPLIVVGQKPPELNNPKLPKSKKPESLFHPYIPKNKEP